MSAEIASGDLRGRARVRARPAIIAVVTKFATFSILIYSTAPRYKDFENLQEKVLAKLSPETGNEYDDCITNLALLQVGDNAALSNSVFDVKRDEIINLDMHGAFIPFCTKMAFLKYYTQSAKNQIHYWSDADKKNYIAAINSSTAITDALLILGINPNES